MANQFNGIIATQTDPFRGSSKISILGATYQSLQMRALTSAVYGLRVSGGISGSFGAMVCGYVGGSTYIIAGLTAVTAAGSYILYPVAYTPAGAAQVGIGVTISLGDANAVVRTVPPSYVSFESGIATAGISASCVVSACLQQNR